MLDMPLMIPGPTIRSLGTIVVAMRMPELGDGGRGGETRWRVERGRGMKDDVVGAGRAVSEGKPSFVDLLRFSLKTTLFGVFMLRFGTTSTCRVVSRGTYIVHHDTNQDQWTLLAPTCRPRSWLRCTPGKKGISAQELLGIECPTSP